MSKISMYTLVLLAAVTSVDAGKHNNHLAAFVRSPTRSAGRNESRPRRNGMSSRIYSSSSSPIYTGPILDTPSQPMAATLQLAELGIDLAVGPSLVSPGQLGLFCRCSDDIDSVALPECTLLCGYANPGTFLDADVGDKTVGFSLTSSTTAVFFDRQLMEIGDALQKAATDYGNGACGLAGHELSMNDQDILTIHQVDGFDRYFCPDLVNREHDDQDVNVQNFGQFCNDLAWNMMSPPSNLKEYMERSASNNCVQLVWRLEYDASCQCLVPSWPVSVLSRDVSFENQEFMELGTRYGWGYWQATVELENLA